jgi:HEAT repeat protein
VYRLGEITPGNHEAVVALVNLIATSREEHTQWLAISSLGKIGAGDPLALDTLLKLVGATDRPLLRKESLDSLVKIAPDHPVCVQTLIAFLEAPGEDSLRWEAAKTLGRLDPGNPEAIAALSGFLRDANDDFTRRQAAASLGAIDPGNLEAILALVRLIRTGEDEGTRELAVESLGEIGTDNPAAIATLIRCLQKEREPKILRSAARSLGAIGRGHREAISSLLKLCQSNADEATRLQAVESLCLAVPPSGFGDIVRDLAGNWANSREKELSFPDRPDPIAQLLLWKCVHHLSYAEFYRAWHSPIRKNPAIVAANRHDFPALLHLLSRELPDGIRLLSVDSALFLDIEHPVVDIYDQMLAQNCPPFEHGIPETLSKLRLYWNQLRRERGDTLPIWVFYDNPLQPRGFSDDFLAALSKFPGDICLVTRRESDFPVTFSPDDPRAIVQWIRENSRRGT